MALTRIWRGAVKAGRFVADDPQGYALRYCAHEGKRIEETVVRERKRKSKKQRSYYFAVIIYILADYFDGDTSPDGIKRMHLSMRSMFLTETFEHGRPPIIRSTEDLSTAECEEYHEKIRRWALIEHGVKIPEPNEVEITA